ncbi:hypothetical protein OPV22_006553 [Ensete ventricosum]|uniref:MAPK kinase substrate protein n=1 Tax=Ensete ventricosum TaxID=4639 RepID=A0AAV8RLL0_ENSVE|nr:hypothetical protein OPV22_006553 [Ensete ventricosum]RWV89626.1 hypothetical protein GW17_00048221 [Ensete ventricosum]
MAGLQRSAQSFRRSGSSGLVWEERFLSGDLSQQRKEEEGGSELKELRHAQTTERRTDFRAGPVLPAADPPSPDASGCFLCGFLRKPTSTKRSKPRRR